ncbi:hypothetical protein MH928_16545 [Flavobacterium sp. WW92]|uniref:hypothetical protein n=1 Tax=unclassified Flavobacterium TaxID=196869 RepID=UPI0022248208|nr:MULTISPECIES: hypothetical protein [unclassified Flavobacterium]WDO12918.1 hypothetical protein MH928_16545 [Flavobacterium sp. WW92]
MKLIILLIIPIFCFSQNDDYNKLKMLPKKELEYAINDSIKKLESLDLWNFLKVIKEDTTIDLKSFNNSLIKKLETSKLPHDLHFLTVILLEQNTHKIILQTILNQKKDIWDKGFWAEKFWKIIRKNSFVVDEDKDYKVDAAGEKQYDIELYLKEKIANDQLGLNPILMVNHTIVSYTENQLMKTLNDLNIKDMQATSKDTSVGLYGKRGIDGMISILTR